MSEAKVKEWGDKMTEQEQLEQIAQEKYRTAWIEAEYIVAGWWIEKPPEQEIEWQPSRPAR